MDNEREKPPERKPEASAFLTVAEYSPALDEFIATTQRFMQLPLSQLIRTTAMLTNVKQEHPDGTPWGEELKMMQRLMMSRLDLLLFALLDAQYYRDRLKRWGDLYLREKGTREN